MFSDVRCGLLVFKIRIVMERQWSNTKNTLVMLLQQEINELQPAVIEMKEEALVKQVAKRKVLYNLTRTGELELVYALLALAEHYLAKGFVQSTIRALHQARTIRDVGDACYLLGSALAKKGEKEEAVHWLQKCLEVQWIEPSLQHQTAAKLQAMTILQQLYFETGQREKLLDLSYKKIREAQGNFPSKQGHFHALALLDLANIHQALGQFDLALQKVDGTINIYESSPTQPDKLIDAYAKRGELMIKLGRSGQAASNYIKASQVLQRNPGCIPAEREASLLEAYIESYILI